MFREDSVSSNSVIDRIETQKINISDVLGETNNLDEEQKDVKRISQEYMRSIQGQQ